MNSDELKARTKAFALAIISLTTKLPKSEIARVINYQILKSSTSIAVNYRVPAGLSQKPILFTK